MQVRSVWQNCGGRVEGKRDSLGSCGSRSRESVTLCGDGWGTGALYRTLLGSGRRGVIPAKAGIQNPVTRLDPRLRRNDRGRESG